MEQSAHGVGSIITKINNEYNEEYNEILIDKGSGEVSNSYLNVDTGTPDYYGPVYPEKRSTFTGFDGGSPRLIAPVPNSSLAIIAGYDDAYINMVDFSDPDNPTLIDSLVSSDFSDMGGITVNGYTAFVIGGGNVNAVDISTGDFTNGIIHSLSINFPSNVAIDRFNDNIYVTDVFSSNSGVVAVDISDPTAMTAMDTFVVPDGLADTDEFGLEISGNILYFSLQGNIFSMDISDPSNLTAAITDLSADISGDSYSIFEINGFLYLINGSTFYRVGVSDPANPSHATTFNYNGSGTYPSTSRGRYIYVPGIASNSTDAESGNVCIFDSYKGSIVQNLDVGAGTQTTGVEFVGDYLIHTDDIDEIDVWGR